MDVMKLTSMLSFYKGLFNNTYWHLLKPGAMVSDNLPYRSIGVSNCNGDTEFNILIFLFVLQQIKMKVALRNKACLSEKKN